MKNLIRIFRTEKNEKVKEESSFSIGKILNVEEAREKEIVEILSYKLGIPKDELYNYVESL